MTGWSQGQRQLFLACILVAVCGSAESSVIRLHDQRGGVQVVASERPHWSEAEGWRLSEEPELVIGQRGDDPRYLFEHVFSFATRPRGAGYSRGPFRLPDGEIVVGELRSALLKFFDPSGRFVRATVGRGEGPTELSLLSELHHCVPGELRAFDDPRGILAVLDSEGQTRDRLFLERNAGRELYMPLSCNRRGQMLAMDSSYIHREDRLGDEQVVLYRMQVQIWLLDSEGYVVQDMGEFPGVEWVDDRLEGKHRKVPHPLGKTTARALGMERAFIGTADEFEIQIWSLDGTLRQRWRRPMADLTIREGDVAAFDSVDPAVANYLRTRWGPSSALVPMPERYPAYTRFLLDATRHLWVEHFRTPRAKRHLWSVFAPDGVWLGEVDVPYTFEITDIGEDYVLGVYRDELDEQSVHMYGLARE